MEAADGEAGKRFTHLLQPIKDLAETWNIDIAAELEQYLEELEGIEMTFEGLQKLNFVEAALVIQGSTNVYSRKVELLHKLVLQALEQVSMKKMEKGGKAAKAMPNYDDHTHLLLLNIPGASNLGQASAEDSGSAPCLRRMPLFLMPREKQDKKRIDHKIGGCAFIKSAVLLEEADQLKYADRLLEGAEPSSPLLPPPAYMQAVPRNGMMMEVDENEPALPEPSPVPMAEPDIEMPEAPLEPDVEPPPPEPEIEEAEPFEDPWQAIDPHENVSKGRPLKVGSTVSKAPARLHRPLSELSLTDPFEQSDMWNLIPQRGLLRKLGLEEFEDCEARVLAEISRRRAERLRANRQPDEPALEEEDLLDGEGDEHDGEGEEEKEEEQQLATPNKKEAEKKWVDGAEAQKMSPSRLSLEFQKKIEDAQRNYDAVVKQKLDELNLFDGAMGGLQHVYATVRKWQDQLEPVLAEQNSRREFDIHSYGKEIVRKIGEDAGDKKDFFAVLHGIEKGELSSTVETTMPKWEQYRYFLAALVLCNNGNVDIHQHLDQPMEERSCTLELLEGGRSIGLVGQAMHNGPGLDDAEPAPAPAEGGAAAPKKRGPKKGKKGAAEPDESADVENPAEAADETPLPETQDEQKEAADKADGNAKRRKKAPKADAAVPEDSVEEVPMQDPKEEAEPAAGGAETEEAGIEEEGSQKAAGAAKRRKKAPKADAAVPEDTMEEAPTQEPKDEQEPAAGDAEAPGPEESGEPKAEPEPAAAGGAAPAEEAGPGTQEEGSQKAAGASKRRKKA